MNRLFQPLAASLLMIASSAAGPQPIPLGDGAQPQLAASAGGAVYITFGRGTDILVARSEDAGKTFGEALVAASVPGMPLGMRRGPRIAATADSVVVTAIESPQGGGRDGDLFAWVSPDQGQTWTKAACPINSVAGAAREGLHAMAADSKGKVAAAWLDLRHVGEAGKGTEIWVSVSEDGGKSWGPDHPVYVNDEGTVCQCCHPSLAFGRQGELMLMFRNAVGGARDMYLTTSRDGGKTFAAAGKLGEGTWKLNACPMDGGSIAVGDQEALTAWRREGVVYVAAPGKPEQRLGQGMQPVIGIGRDGRYVIWQRGTELVVLKPGADKPVQLAERGAFPSLTVTGDGTVIATWQSGSSVMAATLTPAP